MITPQEIRILSVSPDIPGLLPVMSICPEWTA